MLPPDSGTVELSGGVVVEQTFRPEIQRLESVSVMFSGYYGKEQGKVWIELLSNDNVLLAEGFNSADIQDGTILTVNSKEPIETVCGVPVKLRIYAEPAAPVTVMMNNVDMQQSADAFLLTVSVAAQL